MKTTNLTTYKSREIVTGHDSMVYGCQYGCGKKYSKLQTLNSKPVCNRPKIHQWSSESMVKALGVMACSKIGVNRAAL